MEECLLARQVFRNVAEYPPRTVYARTVDSLIIMLTHLSVGSKNWIEAH